MIINIEDSVDGIKRKALLEIIPIKYAIELFNTRVAAANFLGITTRTLRDKIKRYPELQSLENTFNKPEGYYEMKRRYPLNEY